MTAKVFKAYREFKVTLGRLDAAHELSELALRHLAETINGSNFEETVALLAARHGLHVRLDSPQGAYRAIAMAAISAAHACYESFLLDFCSELRELTDIEVDLGKRKKGVAKHDHFVTCLRAAGRLPKSVEFKVLDTMMELIRLTRNEQAHKGRESPKRIDELRRQLVASQHWSVAFGNRLRPSDFSAIGYRDFLLFTYAVRRMAELLSLQLLPSEHRIAHHPEVVAFRSRSEAPSAPRLKLFLQDRFALDPFTAERVLSLL
jgi:hypothetical protein